ncbi:uncharacterized protein LOC129953804 [Eupeodes corollae]|uniref:uncharacterized protein LOC129953804 n=1 Tax=Eupeodes corollae TaxID=290404 RepID=UPI0024938723|nr:uncharacterized protein LOC129953804 [Eupeodes corollae]
MGKVKELTIETRSAIMTLIEEDYSQREIATKLKISKGAVHRTIQRYSSTGGFKDKPRSGRPRVTTKTGDLHIITISMRSRKKTAPEIRAEINVIREEPLSVPINDTTKAKACWTFWARCSAETTSTSPKQDQTVGMGQNP